MKAALVFFGAILFVTFSTPSRADTDYTCLNKCVSTGSPSALCMANCSYNNVGTTSDTLGQTAPTKNGLASAKITNHRVLDTPLPMDGTILLKKPTVQPQALTKDYGCMSVCLQQEKLYTACEQQCTPALTATKPTNYYSQALTKQAPTKTTTGQ